MHYIQNSTRKVFADRSHMVYRSSLCEGQLIGDDKSQEGWVGPLAELIHMQLEVAEFDKCSDWKRDKDLDVLLWERFHEAADGAIGGTFRMADDYQAEWKESCHKAGNMLECKDYLIEGPFLDSIQEERERQD